MMWSTDCECVQGIEHFIDPRPYMPSYESPDDGSFKTGYPWIDDALLAEKESISGSNDDSNKDEDGIDLSRQVILFAHNYALINTGYIHLVAYQVRSCYVKVESDDSLWTDGRVSLIMQHLETGVSRTVPIEIGKRVVIPAELLYPGTIRMALTCLVKSDDYATILSDSLDITVHDPGIKEVNWGKRPDYDVYYHYQTTLRNAMKSLEDINKNVSNTQIKELSLEQDVAELRLDMDKLAANINKFNESLNKLYNLINTKENYKS